jgi:hypothetical protein
VAPGARPEALSTDSSPPHTGEPLGRAATLAGGITVVDGLGRPGGVCPGASAGGEF